MIKVILIDDEPLAISLVKECLKNHSEIEIIAECNNGFEGFKAIQSLQPDLIFLDIQMPKITGFEMLELLDNPPAVIFTTAFDEFALKAFDMHAIDYLLKPFTQERFDKALLKLPALIKAENKLEKQQNLLESLPQEDLNRLVVKVGSSIKIIALNDIFCFEAYDDYVKIHTENDTYLKKNTLSYYESRFEEKQFLRVHRSFLLNLKHISKIELLAKDSHQAVLRNGFEVALSKSGYVRLKERLGL